MTGYYLLDHPPASPQFRRPRREALSGAIGWHTTEGALDRIAPDTGAENVAAYIARRPDPGSYHAIHDSDSTVVMLPDDAEAFHVAADGINRWTVGQAAAMRTTDWHPDDPATRAIIDRMAAWAVDHWRRHGHDPRTCARWLTRAEVLARQPGMFLHGTVQGDRTDAWLRSPHRARLEAMTIAAIHAHTTPPPKEPDVLDQSDKNYLQGQHDSIRQHVSAMTDELKRHIDAKVAAATAGVDVPALADAVADELARRIED